MRKIGFLALVLALAVSANVKWSSAEPPAPAAELIDVLPDGNGLAIIDFQKIVASSLWATITSQEKLKNSMDKVSSEMAELGLSLNDLSSVALVFSSDFNNPAVAVTGRFEQNDLLARLRASGKVKLSSEKYKDFDIYKVVAVSAGSESKGGEKSTVKSHSKNDTAFVFHGANTLVAGSMESVRASVDVKTGAKPGIAQNGKLSDAISQNPTAAIRFALTVTPAMKNGLQSSELPLADFSSISLIFGAIDVTAGLDINATLRSDTAEHAKAIADRLSGLLSMAAGSLGLMGDPKLAPLGEALKTVRITNSEADVKITGNVSTDVLNSLIGGRK